MGTVVSFTAAPEGHVPSEEAVYWGCWWEMTHDGRTWQEAARWRTWSEVLSLVRELFGEDLQGLSLF
jgi:hypothetical protein